jgi:ABC-type dipeptide/oligopeptide/nickel transport system permease component
MKKSWFPWIIASIFFIFFLLLIVNMLIDRSQWFDESFSILFAESIHVPFFWMILFLVGVILFIGGLIWELF